MILLKVITLIILVVFVNSNSDNIRCLPTRLSSINDLTVDVPKFTIPLLTVNGSDFGNAIMNIGPTQTREDLIFSQYERGNVPDFMRNPIPVVVNSENYTLKYWVLPDVLSVGTDEDYLRTPINPLTAKKIADLYNSVLPTRKIAFQIWQAATIKLTPSPNGPPYDATMMSTERLIFHNNKIQIALAGRSPGELITGHKKDVVISKALLTNPRNVAIVGWWYPTGQLIQPLNAVSHDHYYKDYSHGIRLIHRMVTINEQWYDIYDVLRDKILSTLISDEGPFDATQMYT